MTQYIRLVRADGSTFECSTYLYGRKREKISSSFLPLFTAKSHFGNQPEYMNVRILSLLAVQLLVDTLASRGKEFLTVLTS